jgi:hypothetical protein
MDGIDELKAGLAILEPDDAAVLRLEAGRRSQTRRTRL